MTANGGNCMIADPKLYRKLTGIHICTNHEGKMSTLWSLSTSPINPYCEKRSKIKGSICEKCFSLNMMKYRHPLEACLSKNAEILNNRILSRDEIPEITNNMFRFESFGEVTTEIQFVNYINITKANPEVHFALWTKNPWIIDSAIKNYHLRKPRNLVIIGSSYFINKPMAKFYKRYDFIDYIFTVYDKAYIRENDVDINCGGQSCRSCKKCYYKKHKGYEIREILK